MKKKHTRLSNQDQKDIAAFLLGQTKWAEGQQPQGDSSVIPGA